MQNMGEIRCRGLIHSLDTINLYLGPQKGLARVGIALHFSHVFAWRSWSIDGIPKLVPIVFCGPQGSL